MFNQQANRIEPVTKEDIFTADEARQMGEEAKNRLRNANRRSIFSLIKQQLNAGSSRSYVNGYLLNDGNDIYFEGLGYKLQRGWVHPMTGVWTEEMPLDTGHQYQPYEQTIISWEK